MLCMFTMIEKNKSLSSVTTSLTPVAENVTATEINNINKTYALGSTHKCLYVKSMSSLNFMPAGSDVNDTTNTTYITLLGVLLVTGVFLFYWAYKSIEKRKDLATHDKLTKDDVWTSHEIEGEQERNRDDDEDEMLILGGSSAATKEKEIAVDL